MSSLRKYTRAYKFRYNSIFYNHVQIWIRRATRGTIHYYSVVDAIAGLTGSKNPRDYLAPCKEQTDGSGQTSVVDTLSTTAFKGPGRQILPDRQH